MLNQCHRLAIRMLFCAFAAASCYAQTITGTIVGSVVDPSGAALTGAEVSAVQKATGAKRTVHSNEQGDFLVGSLQPGEYSVSVSRDGFKTAQRTGIVLSSAETLPVGRIALEIGSISEQVSVTAEGVAVQVASSERAGVISSSQLENLMTKGRNAMTLLTLLPGVVDGQGVGSQERIDRNFDLNVQGNRRNANTVTVDGMPVNPMGNNFNGVVMVSQDAIAEVKVLMSNYPAEYGRSTGATVNFVTKSGTKDFHGLFSYFKRHEQFNANDFFNNRLSRPKARYRYNTWNYNIGGPVPISKINKNRDKLFFFWSQEFWPLTVPTSIAQLTVPTLLERRGDFTQSIDLNGRVIPVTDPTSRQVFPGNVVPASRLDQSGLALLKVFPDPNFSDRGVSGGRYNYVFQSENQTPIRMENARVDYNIRQNHSLAFTLASYVDQQSGAVGILTSGSTTNWPQMKKTYRLHGQGYILRYTGVLSPTLINETSFGWTRRPEGNSAEEAEIKRNQKVTAGYTAGQFNPEINPLGLIPNANFGGVTNPATLYMEGRFPFYQKLHAFNLTNNLTKVMGSHTFKTGIMVERNYQGSLSDGQYTGTFNFQPTVNNPLDSGYAYSNAALGVFQTYSEASSRVILSFRQHAVEWFVQDTWRATRRLTLELGMRFHHLTPIYMRSDRLTTFAPELYNASQGVQLIRPARVNNVRVGVHPVTGAVLPATLIGAIAPGTGNPTNGMAVAGQNGFPRGLISGYGIQFGPRIGFAYDVFGTGKTAIRGGFGQFYGRPNMSENLLRFSAQPPLISTPTVYYGMLNSLTSSAGSIFPQGVNAFDRSDRVPRIMNFSLSVQQNIGWNTVVDVGYVGSLGRNQLWIRDLNPIPAGANFDPRNADPSNPSTPLTSSFLRPIVGYNDILMSEPAASSNYHSMQVTARRRFAKGFQFGMAWTWSKSMNYNNFDTNPVSVLLPVRVWNYGLSSADRTHNARIDWTWDIPAPKLANKVAHFVARDWQLSGITSFGSGAPLGVGYTLVTAQDITGTASQAARLNLTGNPIIPKGERTFSRNFDPSVFRLPARGTFGNSATTQIRGPGINNWDISLLKTFPVHERLRVQFRAEAYNAFNHTQFASLDTTARFDAQGNQVNSRLGEFLAARAPRIMQLALRLYF
ncbi:MAG: carboxypeptidase regulatory-like domain-containing protein [Bryobacterales bacterium]|nr:carboxypeptidase regulatory-like domain-containing protein [Bryobacterales bacterium]